MKDDVREKVEEVYGRAAQRYSSGEASGCCGGSSSQIGVPEQATRFYSEEELAGLPQSATEMSLGCGNPLALAELREGDVVLDLGSGAGLDCFLAARKVGNGGRVIGLDMTEEMIRLARENAAKAGLANVEFRQGYLEQMPLEDASVDHIISNCVINLSPDKDAVFSEAYRVLKPGGRLSVSDVVTSEPLPAPLRESAAAWAACIAGALDEEEYLAKLRAAGFRDIEVVDKVPFPLDAPDVKDLAEKALGSEAASALALFRGLTFYSVKLRAGKPA